jgi:hypothetical protein
MQQNFGPMSVVFPPDVPNFTGAACAEAVSLGKTCDGVGVGVGEDVATVELEPPPHPTAQTRTMDPNRMLKPFDIVIQPSQPVKNCCAFKWTALD